MALLTQKLDPSSDLTSKEGATSGNVPSPADPISPLSLRPSIQTGSTLRLPDKTLDATDDDLPDELLPLDDSLAAELRLPPWEILVPSPRTEDLLPLLLSEEPPTEIF
jgi:hypothetical protein